MIGTCMNDLKQCLKTNHEIEFSYHDAVYSIEPGGSDNQILFSIWKSKPNTDTADCICEYFTSLDVNSYDTAIDEFLSTKCFDGKSFMDIENEITVDVIF